MIPTDLPQHNKSPLSTKPAHQRGQLGPASHQQAQRRQISPPPFACRTDEYASPFPNQIIHNILPVETMTEIFIIYCMSFPFRPLHPNTDETPPPCIISRVCRTWYSIVYGMPKLWTRLSFFPSPELITKNPKTLERISTTWLNRGKGTLPMDICIRDDRPSSDYFTPKYHMSPPCTVLGALIPFASQWRTLDLLLPITHYIKYPDIKEPLHCPRLEKMRLLVSWFSILRWDRITLDMLRELTRFFDVVKHSPKLEDLCIEVLDHPCINLLDVIQLPWAQLRNLELKNITFSGTYEMQTKFSLATKLERASLTLNQWDYSISDSSTVILPRLKVLELRFQGSSCITQFLAPFRLPALEQLHLSHCHGIHAPDTGIALLNLMARSRESFGTPSVFSRPQMAIPSFPLRVFHLTRVEGMDYNHLIAFLSGVSSTLEDFRINLCPDFDEYERLFQALNSMSEPPLINNSVLLPRLSTLQWSHPTVSEIMLLAFAVLVESRWWVESCNTRTSNIGGDEQDMLRETVKLREVYLRTEDALGTNEVTNVGWKKLQKCKQTGLDFQYRVIEG